MNSKVDRDFLVKWADNGWPKIEKEVLEKLSEIRCFDGDIWAFKKLFKVIEVKRVGGNGKTSLEYQVILEKKKYFFSFEKRQGIWFLVEFKEV